MSGWIAPAFAAELDTPERRGELARLATGAARAACPGVDIEMFWDEVWIRRVGPHCFPDPDMFRAAEPRWDRWAGAAEKCRRDAGDYWFHLYHPAEGDVIVDIGAGRGEDVFAFAPAVGGSGAVWAIEPHPVSFAALGKLCEWNGLSNVRTIQCACTETPADLQIETLPVWESNWVRGGAPSAGSFPVKGVPFDALCEEHGIGRIDFLKMNIEGAERVALPGCRRALERTRFVCVAAHDFRADRGEGEQFRTFDMVRRFLEGCGFELTIRASDSRYYVPYHVHGRRTDTI